VIFVCLAPGGGRCRRAGRRTAPHTPRPRPATPRPTSASHHPAQSHQATTAGRPRCRWPHRHPEYGEHGPTFPNHRVNAGLDQNHWTFRSSSGRVRLLSHRPTDAHPEVLIIALLVAAVITVDRRRFVLRVRDVTCRCGPRRCVVPVVWFLVSRGEDSVDELGPSGFESSTVAGDRRLGEFGGCEL
jgi:hypothetical protein